MSIVRGIKIGLPAAFALLVLPCLAHAADEGSGRLAESVEITILSSNLANGSAVGSRFVPGEGIHATIIAR